MNDIQDFVFENRSKSACNHLRQQDVCHSVEIKILLNNICHYFNNLVVPCVVRTEIK